MSFGRQKAKVLRQQEQVAGFLDRAPGNDQELAEFRQGAAAFPFCDVGGNGGRGPAKLVGQSETLRGGEVLGDTVDLQHGRMGLLPNQQVAPAFNLVRTHGLTTYALTP